MFKINDKEIKEFEADLKTFARKAYPFATKNTINQAAFTAQTLAKLDIQTNMVNRNKFTVQSIQVEQSRTLQVSRQAAVVGSTADYMETQEFGGIKAKTGSQGVSIATSYSAGQGEGAVRTRLPRKANTLAAIKLRKRGGKALSRRQRTVVQIKAAATTGKRFVFLDLGRKKGIFRVIGGVRNAKIKMVHDMTEQSVTIPRNPWLKPAVDTTQIMIPDMYKKSLVFQLRKQGLFRG